MSIEPVVSLSDITKTFGKTVALNAMDMEVTQGEVHGLLGPNGAGKSTAIRILLGLLRKDKGTARVLGGDPWREAVRLHARLSYVPGEVHLWENLSGGEIVDLLMHLRGSYNAKRREELLDRFQLDPAKKFRTYSKGNRQKVALVAALASDVDLYIFDEPTSGLDPLLALVFQEEVKALKDKGKTVLLSSHILAEVEALCDRVTIIREGSVVESGSLDTLRHLTSTTMKVVTAQPVKDMEAWQGVRVFEVDNTSVHIEVEPDQLNATLAKLAEYGVESIVSHPPTLEELFIRYYENESA